MCATFWGRGVFVRYQILRARRGFYIKRGGIPPLEKVIYAALAIGELSCLRSVQAFR